MRLAREIATKERYGLTTRAYIAKELAANLHTEITDKLHMFSKIKSYDKILTYSSLSRVRFMQSRFQEMS